MPINKEIYKEYYPIGNLKLSKYMNFLKFISMLKEKSLFFCRLDILEDKYEGVAPDTYYLRLFERFKRLQLTEKFEFKTDKEIWDCVMNIKNNDERIKSIQLINCWHVFNEESAAMWKIYASFNEGIMIKSTVEKLEKALENCSEDLFMGKVIYFDHETELYSNNGLIDTIMHKHKLYSYEDEIRLIHILTDMEKGSQFDWNMESVKEGKYLKANLDTLIDEIIISPYASDYFVDLVSDITHQQYKIDKPVNKSRFSP